MTAAERDARRPRSGGDSSGGGEPTRPEVDLRRSPDPATLIASLAREGGAPSDPVTTSHLEPPHPEQPHLEQPHLEQPHAESARVEQPRVEQPHVETPAPEPEPGQAEHREEMPPPPPGQRAAAGRARDAVPYPDRPDRPPIALVGIGVGIGLAVLAVIGLVAAGMRGLGNGSDTSALPSGSPSPISVSQISVTASSTQESEGGITYSAENTLDGKPETAWNSDGRKDGKGPGMTLTYGFGDPVQLTGITVLNGYQKTITSSGKTQDLYELNSRVGLVRLVTDTATFTWELADDQAPQTLTKAFGPTSSVRLEVLSVYPGSKYLDLALSEISFTAVG